MITQTSEHALRALLYLAHQPESVAASAERIARAIGAPANYLAKTLNVLAKEGLVTSKRGPTGGFRLGRPAEEISLEAVMEGLGESRVTSMCMLGDRPCNARTPCRAHRRWEEVRTQMQAPLRRTTLADLLQPQVYEIPAAGADAGEPGRAAPAA